MKEILIPLNFTTTPTVYDTLQSFSTSDEASGVLTFTTTADVAGTVASLTIRNASENANRQTVLIERLDVNRSPFSYTFENPLPFGQYEGTVLLKKNLMVIASASFLFGVNSSLAAEVLPYLVKAYSLDELVENVETEVSKLKDAFTLTVSETVKGVNKTESSLQAQENVRYLNEHQRKANELERISNENARIAAELARKDTFDTLVDSEVIEQTVVQEVAEKYQEIEALNAPEMVSFRQQLADKATKAELASVASGSPKGVYATLSALQSAYPSGNTNIYVVSADGNWYYWNGGAWTSGGVYQSEKLADNSVLLKNLSDDIVKKIHNIKDYNVASNALTDFTAVGTTALSLNGAYIKALSSGAPVEFKQYKDWGLPIGDKILVTFKVRANKSGNIIIYLLTNNVGGVLSSTTQSISATERTVSVVMSGPSLCNGIYFVGNDFTTSGDYVEILDLVVSDLSPVFGSGNEPTATKTRYYIWCSDNKYTDIREFLLTDTIQGAVVYVVKGTNTYTLTHNVLLSDINLVVRTDVITISGIVVTEVRTAFTGDVVTIKTNTTTLSTEVS